MFLQSGKTMTKGQKIKENLNNKYFHLYFLYLEKDQVTCQVKFVFILLKFTSENLLFSQALSWWYIIK